MPIQVYAQVFLCTLLWGSAFPVAKTALEYVGPLNVAGLRFTLAGLILLSLSLFVDRAPLSIHVLYGRTGPPNPRWGYVMLVGLLGTSVFYGLFFIGVNMTSASSAAAVDAASPIIHAMMAHFFLHHDRLNPRKAVALATAFAGILTISVLKPASGDAGTSTLGCLIILISLFFGGAGTMLVVRYTGSLSLIRLTGFQMCFGGTLLLVMAYLREGMVPWQQPGLWKLAVLIGWLAIVSAAAFRMWYGIIRRYKVTSLSVFSFLSGTWGVIMSIAFLGDPVTWPLVVGGSLVIAGVIQMHLSGEGHARPEPADNLPEGAL